MINNEYVTLLETLITKGVWGEHNELFGGWRIGQLPKEEKNIVNQLKPLLTPQEKYNLERFNNDKV